MRGDKARLGSDIVLPELNANSVAQAEGIRTQNRATGDGKSDPRQPQSLFKSIKEYQIGNLVNSAELASTLNVSRTTIDAYLFLMQK